jgi:hypothetical protein
MRRSLRSLVMAGLVPSIHVERHAGDDVDARDKPGHDGARGAYRLALKKSLSISAASLSPTAE